MKEYKCKKCGFVGHKKSFMSKKGDLCRYCLANELRYVREKEHKIAGDELT